MLHRASILAALAFAPLLGSGGDAASCGDDGPRRPARPSFVAAVRAAAAASARQLASTPPTSFAFVDATAPAGIVDHGISFGVSVGDADGDGWPDVFTSGHYTAHSRLWLNQRNGTFAPGIAGFSPAPAGDLHAAQWIDFDNDGQQELVVLSGASYGTSAEPKRVYKRAGAGFVDVAPQWGLDVATMRGRTPLAVDYDRDGVLDVFLTAALRPDGLTPPSLYRFELGRFHEVGSYQGFQVQTATSFGVLGDLDEDGRLDAFFEGFPNRAYGFSPVGVHEITGSLGLPAIPPFPMLQDMVVADFTGDGRNDLYLARETNRSSAHRDGAHTIEFCALLQGQEHAVRFTSLPGHLMWFDWGDAGVWTTAHVHIGAMGAHPASAYGFALDPGDPSCHGVAPHTAGQDLGIYVGFDPATAEWVVACSAPTQQEAYVRAISSLPVADPTPIGFSPTAAAPSDLLLVRSGNGYVDRTASNGVPAWLRGRSAVAADFDNDMDLDLYVVRSTRSRNVDNVLLENLGGGVFAPAPGMAPGSAAGLGDAVATLDYDADGRVDLFVVNGTGRAYRGNGAPGAFADDGPAQLLRNVCANGNRWLGVRLVGTQSNREGIGARVEVLAGGVTQAREHGGGMHRAAQNHGIHFGLGANRAAAHVLVRWPSGRQSIVRGVASNQTVTIVE